MKKLFFLTSALLYATISVSAVEYLVQTGKDGDARWTAEAISALSISADKVIDLSAESAVIPTTSEIWFAAGTYEFTATYQIEAGAKLYGGFAGTETSIDERAMVSGGKLYEFANPTIFNAIQPTEGAPVKLFPDGKANVILNGLTIQGSATTAADGGAIKLGNKSEAIACKFLNNTSGTKNGGAILAYNVSITIESCYFESNSANAGGAVYVASGGTNVAFGRFESRIAHNVFVGNTATATGGALHIQGPCRVIVDANVICNNTSKQHACAIYDNGNNISVITNNVVYNNSYLGSNNTCCYIKPKHFANNTICNNQGNVYFATNTDSAVVANNVIWGNLQGEALTGVSFADPKDNVGLTALNNYTSNTIPATDKGLVLSKTEGVENTNHIFTAQERENEVGPYFVRPTSFVGAIDLTSISEETTIFELEAADWSLKEESMLIDAGTDLTWVTNDIVGTVRKAGTYDVGAYEYVAEIGSAVENTAKPAVDIRAALQAGEVYNILGQRVCEIQAGNIYIVSGQKMLVR